MDKPFHAYATPMYFNQSMENQLDDVVRLATDFDEIWD